MSQPVMPEVVITVKPDGSVTVDVLNWQGPSCALASEPYRNALGVAVASTPKAEMYAPDAALFSDASQKRQEAKQ
jgi:DUF2997 family protein